jgi:hypothetical protein
VNEADRLHAAIGVISDQVTALHHEVHGDSHRTQEVVREAVAAGIRDVLSDEKVVANFWKAALTQVQDHAQREAGGLVIAGFKKAATIGVILVLAYSVGGFAMVKQAWHWVTAP